MGGRNASRMPCIVLVIHNFKTYCKRNELFDVFNGTGFLYIYTCIIANEVSFLVRSMARIFTIRYNYSYI